MKRVSNIVERSTRFEKSCIFLRLIRESSGLFAFGIPLGIPISKEFQRSTPSRGFTVVLPSEIAITKTPKLRVSHTHWVCQNACPPVRWVCEITNNLFQTEFGIPTWHTPFRQQKGVTSGHHTPKPSAKLPKNTQPTTKHQTPT